MKNIYIYRILPSKRPGRLNWANAWKVGWANARVGVYMQGKDTVTHFRLQSRRHLSWSCVFVFFIVIKYIIGLHTLSFWREILLSLCVEQYEHYDRWMLYKIPLTNTCTYVMSDLNYTRRGGICDICVTNIRWCLWTIVIHMSILIGIAHGRLCDFTQEIGGGLLHEGGRMDERIR